MQLVVNSGMLLKALQLVQGAIPSSTIFPILDNFLFKVEEGTLHITATDNHVTMQTSLPVDGEDGSFCVPSKMLVETLKATPEQPITLLYYADRDNAIEIKTTSGEGEYKLVGFADVDYPAPQRSDEATQKFTISGQGLLQGIETSLFAVGTDEMRLSMTGIYFQVAADKLTLVATDAHKLVKYEWKDIQGADEGTFIVPRREMSLLKNVLAAKADSDVQVEFTAKNVRFDNGLVTISARLIDAKYPDYTGVIPAENPNELFINRLDLMSALKRVSLYASRTTHQIRLKLSGGVLHISAEDMDYAYKANHKINCEYNGEEMEIGFNAKFLADMLSSISSETVKIAMSLPSRPGVVTPTEQAPSSEVLMLIMPLMISNLG